MNEMFIDPLWQEGEGWVRSGTLSPRRPLSLRMQGQNGPQGLDTGHGKSVLHSSGESDIGGREGNMFCLPQRVLASPSTLHQEACSSIAWLFPSSTRDR